MSARATTRRLKFISESRGILKHNRVCSRNHVPAHIPVCSTPIAHTPSSRAGRYHKTRRNKSQATTPATLKRTNNSWPTSAQQILCEARVSTAHTRTQPPPRQQPTQRSSFSTYSSVAGVCCAATTSPRIPQPPHGPKRSDNTQPNSTPTEGATEGGIARVARQLSPPRCRRDESGLRGKNKCRSCRQQPTPACNAHQTKWLALLL